MTVTISKGLGQEQVQLERYHLHVLRTPTEVKNAVSYVVFNELRHSGKKLIKVDGYSSVGRYLKLTSDCCVTKLDQPRSWLLSSQWQ